MRRLLGSGIGTVAACQAVGIGHKPGYRWRAETADLPPRSCRRARRRVKAQQAFTAMAADQVGRALLHHDCSESSSATRPDSLGVVYGEKWLAFHHEEVRVS
jgi:hypothetical protein